MYIGKTDRTLDIRKQEHLRDCWKLEKDNKLYRAMRKYGINNFIFEIIEDNIPKEELSLKERYYINYYNSYYEGYNSTFGGEGESSVDIDKIIMLYNQGYTIKEIHNLTNYATKTISFHLKMNNCTIVSHKGKNSQGKNKTEVRVGFENMEFNSITELASFLKQNYEIFSNKQLHTIIVGISDHLKRNTPYCGFQFYHLY